MSKIQTLFLSAVLFIGLVSCSTSQQTTSSNNNSGMYPGWYVVSEFSSDSVSYSGYGTAVSSDSVIAVANAQLVARTTLESSLAQNLEEARLNMEEEGSDIAREADFLIAIRNAHQAIEDEADLTTGSAKYVEGYYRGFAQVGITKNALYALIQQELGEGSQYWQALQANEVFAEIFD